MRSDNLIKRSRHALHSLPAALFVGLGIAAGQAPPADILNRTLPDGPASADQSPVYAAHAILVRARVSGGVVYLGDDGPAAATLLPEGAIVSDALTRVLAGQTKYFWREIDGVIDISPVKGIPPLLATRVRFFEWRSSESPYNAVSRLSRLPEVVGAMSQLGYVDGLHNGPGPQKPPRVFGPPEPPEPQQVFVRRDITLLDLLNEIVKSYPASATWWYTESPRGGARSVDISAHWGGPARAIAQRGKPMRPHLPILIYCAVAARSQSGDLAHPMGLSAAPWSTSPASQLPERRCGPRRPAQSSADGGSKAALARLTVEPVRGPSGRARTLSYEWLFGTLRTRPTGAADGIRQSVCRRHQAGPRRPRISAKAEIRVGEARVMLTHFGEGDTFSTALWKKLWKRSPDRGQLQCS